MVFSFVGRRQRGGLLFPEKIVGLEGSEKCHRIVKSLSSCRAWQKLFAGNNVLCVGYDAGNAVDLINRLAFVDP
jgi:hypothetical protein